MAGTGAAEVFIYDELSPWGVTADEFVRDLRQITNSKIDLHLHSPGGNAWDGIAIYQALKNHPAEVTVYVDSLAASAASFIAMAGKRRVIGPHATMMIHDAAGLCWGNAADMAKTAEDLGRMSDNIAAIYASRAGTEVEPWREAMRTETWYTAQEAVAAGLMDEVQADEKAEQEPAMKNRFDLSVFNFAGRGKAPAPTNVALDEPPAVVREPAVEVVLPDPPAEPAPIDLPAAEPEHVTTEPKEEDLVSDLSEVRSRLGLDDNADENAILVALDELKSKADTPAAPVTDPAVEAEVEAAKAENADLRKEVELVSARMEALAGELAATKAEKAAEAKATFLDSAQKQGKFKPSDRAQWEIDYDAAPEAVTRMLNRIEPGTAVPVNVVGETGSAEPNSDDMTTFEADMARLDGPFARKVA
jgi:ATP-dependent protease ClpP protease subunit